MASLSIRNIEDEIKYELRVQAASHGVSMEEEARVILKEALIKKRDSKPANAPGENWYQSIRKLVEENGGFDLEIPPRGKGMREPPSFE